METLDKIRTCVIFCLKLSQYSNSNLVNMILHSTISVESFQCTQMLQILSEIDVK